MLTHVERKHWYTQLPFSWGVEIMLVLALLAGTAFAATQVRGRDATIADQAVMLEAARVQQAATMVDRNATVTQQEEFRAQLEQGLVLQKATIDQQAATIRQFEPQMVTLRRVAEMDSALIEAYGLLPAQRAALEQARRGDYGEVYESTAIAEAAVAQTEASIHNLLVERQLLLSWPPGYESK